MNLHKMSLASVVLTAGLFTQAMAAPVIVDWSFAGQPGNEASVSPSSSVANVIGANVQRGAGITPNLGANSINSRGWNSQLSDYYGFGFSVGAGFEVDLESLYIGTRSSPTGPATLGLYYGGDGYAAALTTFLQAPGNNFLDTVVDLSALQDLTGNLEFRISQIGTTAANGDPTTNPNGTFRITDYFAGGSFDRNMQFTGTVVRTSVPEPATLLLVAFALAGLIAVRARRSA